MEKAEELARLTGARVLSERHQGWRAGAVSDPQLRYMRQLGVNIPEHCTKGQAAQLIGQALCQRAVEQCRVEQEREIWQRAV